MRDLLRRRLRGWRRRLAGEMKALREPPMNDADAESVVFQMKSLIRGHSELRRLLDDTGAGARRGRPLTA